MALLFRNVNVIDVVKGKVETGLDVLVADGLISKIGKSLEAPDARVVDGTGQFLMPGMIDAHIHIGCSCTPDFMDRIERDPPEMIALRAVKNARDTLYAGITTVRNAGEKNHVDTFVRGAIERGEIEGPTLVTAGRGISVTGGHGYPGIRRVSGADDARQAVREHVEAGAMQIKIIASGGVLTKGTVVGAAQMTLDEMKAVTSEAKAFDRRTFAHAHGERSIRNCLEAGIDTIEHGSFPDKESIKTMVARGTIVVPTFAATESIHRNGGAGMSEEILKKSESTKVKKVECFREMVKAGVKIAMGTDAGSPYNFHGKNALELEMMVRYGMTPMEAIIASTLISAEACALSDVTGSVEVGKWADLLLLSGDPTEDVSRLQDAGFIRMILRRGEVIKHAAQ